MPAPTPPPLGQDLRQWGRQLSDYILRNISKLAAKSTNDNPSEDGVILWDRENRYPVVSYNNEFRQLVMSGADAVFGRSTDVTAAAADTAYSITYDTPSHAHQIAKDATYPERLVFSETGHYLINFTAQIDSTTSSSVDFYFWPAIDGIDIGGSTMKNTLKQSGSTLVVSRSGLFEISANSYLEVKWATSSTTGQLTSFAATAFCPATPSTTLTITRVHV